MGNNPRQGGGFWTGAVSAGEGHDGRIETDQAAVGRNPAALRDVSSARHPFHRTGSLRSEKGEKGCASVAAGFKGSTFKGLKVQGFSKIFCLISLIS